jgi:hypothetical protein
MKRVHEITLNALVRYNNRYERADVRSVMSQMIHDGAMKSPKERRVKRWLSKLVKEGLAEQYDQDKDLRVYSATRRGRRKYDLYLGSL